MVEPEGAAEEYWCAQCNRLIMRDDLRRDDAGDARCPHCDVALLDHQDAAVPLAEDAPKAPWHFKVLLVGTVIYLIYRLIWFIFWISHRL